MKILQSRQFERKVKKFTKQEKKSLTILAEPGKDRFACPNRIFFVNWICGNPAKVFPLV